MWSLSAAHHIPTSTSFIVDDSQAYCTSLCPSSNLTEDVFGNHIIAILDSEDVHRAIGSGHFTWGSISCHLSQRYCTHR